MTRWKKRKIGWWIAFAILAGTYLAKTNHLGEDPMAECRDGSLSYSAQHSGACSWHGGVSRWIR